MAERSSRVLLTAAAGAMEITWLYAAVAFLFDLNGLGPFPVGGAALVFSMGLVLTGALRGRGWRMIQVLAVQLVGFLLSASAALHAFGRWTEPGRRWIDLRWLAALGEISGTDEGATLILVICCCCAFWASGVALARRPLTGAKVTARFDIGIGVLCFVLFLGWAARMSSPAVRLLIPSYFLFGTLAVALSRLGASGSRSYSAGFAEAGVALSLAVSAVFVGAAVVRLLPLLEGAARAGYGVLRAAALHARPWLLALLRFLFGFWAPRAAEPASALPGAANGILRAVEESGRGSGLMDRIGMWVMILLAGGAALAVTGWALVRLLRFLLSRTPADRRRGRPWAALLAGLLRFLDAARAALRRLFLVIPAAGAGVRAFTRLERWAGRSGAARQPGETPLEFGARLGRVFPTATTEVATVVAALVEELYGARASDSARAAELRRCRLSLGSPRHWPMRLENKLRPD